MILFLVLKHNFEKKSLKFKIVSFFLILTVSMEFFDDITIPYEYLQQPSKLYPLVVIVKTQY